jgi:hypothetical protein
LARRSFPPADELTALKVVCRPLSLSLSLSLSPFLSLALPLCLHLHLCRWLCLFRCLCLGSQAEGLGEKEGKWGERRGDGGCPAVRGALGAVAAPCRSENACRGEGAETSASPLIRQGGGLVVRDALGATAPS